MVKFSILPKSKYKFRLYHRSPTWYSNIFTNRLSTILRIQAWKKSTKIRKTLCNIMLIPIIYRELTLGTVYVIGIVRIWHTVIPMFADNWKRHYATGKDNQSVEMLEYRMWFTSSKLRSAVMFLESCSERFWDIAVWKCEWFESFSMVPMHLSLLVWWNSLQN